MHPIAAQGFNLALYEVAALAEVLAAQMDCFATLAQTNLEAVVKRVEKQNAASIGVSHHLPQLFAKNTKWMSILSQFGMVGFDIAMAA